MFVICYPDFENGKPSIQAKLQMPFIRLEQETSEHVQYCKFAIVLVFCIIMHEVDLHVEDFVALAVSYIVL
jgi:hypothetical protein